MSGGEEREFLRKVLSGFHRHHFLNWLLCVVCCSGKSTLLKKLAKFVNDKAEDEYQQQVNDVEREESNLDDVQYNIRQIESEYNFTRSMIQIHTPGKSIPNL